MQKLDIAYENFLNYDFDDDSWKDTFVNFIGRFLRYSTKSNFDELIAMSVEYNQDLLERWVNRMSYHLKNSTIMNNINAIEILFSTNNVSLDYGKIYRLIPDVNPITGTAYTNDDIRKMFEVILDTPKRGLSRLLNRAVLSFFTTSAIQPKELVMLKVGDLIPNLFGGWTVNVKKRVSDWEHSYFIDHNNWDGDTTDLNAVVFVTKQTREYVEDYLNQRVDINLDSPVFKIAHKSLDNLFQKITKSAEIDKTISWMGIGNRTSFHKPFRRRFYEVGLDCKVDESIIHHLLGEEKTGFDTDIPKIESLTSGYMRMIDSLDNPQKSNYPVSP